MVHLLSPTGQSIRKDPAGDGHYGSPRSKIVDGKVVTYKHAGTDSSCTPGQTCWAPHQSVVVRPAYPYKNDKTYLGILLDAGWCLIKLFYLEPFVGVGVELYRGQPIGIAQDVTLKYPGIGMTPHIHWELSRFSNNPELYTISGGHK